MILLTLFACSDITFALHAETARTASPTADTGDTGGGWWDSSDTGGGWDSSDPDIGETVGSFGEAISLPLTTPTINFLKTGDVNGDGRTDIVFTGSDFNGWTYGDHAVYLGVGLQQSDGSFSFTETLLSVTSDVRTYLEIGDVNGDGYDDAVVGHFEGVTVFYGDSGGSMATTETVTDPWTSALTLGDLDDDGDLDLAVLNVDLEVVIYTNDDGDLTETDRWNPNWLYSGDWDYSDVKIKDIDSDGHADLVTIYPWQTGSDPSMYTKGTAPASTTTACLTTRATLTWSRTTSRWATSTATVIRTRSSASTGPITRSRAPPGRAATSAPSWPGRARSWRPTNSRRRTWTETETTICCRPRCLRWRSSRRWTASCRALAPNTSRTRRPARSRR